MTQKSFYLMLVSLWFFVLFGSTSVHATVTITTDRHGCQCLDASEVLSPPSSPACYSLGSWTSAYSCPCNDPHCAAPPAYSPGNCQTLKSFGNAYLQPPRCNSNNACCTKSTCNTIIYKFSPNTGLSCTIACSSNANCNDSNSCTTDTCVNPGTSGASCSNTNVSVNGTWTYSAWGACSGNCGGGTGTQTRTALSCSATCGGTCGATVLSQSCTNNTACVCSQSCTGSNQCALGYCTLSGCRNPVCGTQPSCICPACTTNTDCDDGNACTANICNTSGVCVYPPVTPTDSTWQQGGYGTCSIPCGIDGTKTQTVTCSGALCGGNTVCNPLTKPAETISCDGPGPCPCNQICDNTNDCSTGLYCNASLPPGKCRNIACPSDTTCPISGGTWDGCGLVPFNPANWEPCSGGVCNGASPVIDSGEQVCKIASCNPVCGGSCGAVPTRSCTPTCDNASVSCHVVVGFGSASGSACKSIKINSQGLVYDGEQVDCP